MYDSTSFTSPRPNHLLPEGLELWQQISPSQIFTCSLREGRWWGGWGQQGGEESMEENRWPHQTKFLHVFPHLTQMCFWSYRFSGEGNVSCLSRLLGSPRSRGVGLLSQRLVLLKKIPHISIKQQLCFGTALKTDPGGHVRLGVCGRTETETLFAAVVFF